MPIEVITERTGSITFVVSNLPPRPTSIAAKSHFYSLKYRNPVAVKYLII
jgi:hypothetical protein